MLRSLFNIRMPQPAGREFLEIQDMYLQEYKQQTNSEIEVVFNVFKQMYYEIYRALLERYH